VTIEEAERRVFLVFCATLTWIDMPWFPSSSAFVRPAAIWAMMFGLGLIALRPALGLRIDTKVILQILPWLLVALATTVLSLTLYDADWQFKERTRLGSGVREFLGAFIAICGFVYCANVVPLFKSRTQRIFSALSFGCWVSLAIASLQIGWFFFKNGACEALARVIEVTLLTRGQVGKVHGLAPEGSMFGDLAVTLIFPFFMGTMMQGDDVSWWSGKRWIPLAGMLVTVACIFGTVSRVALPALAVSLLVGGVLTARGLKQALSRLVPMAVAGAVLFAILLTLPAYRSALFSGFGALGSMENSVGSEQWSNVTRASEQLAAVKSLAAHPLGLGFGQFMFFSRQEMPWWAFLSPEVQAMYGNYRGLAAGYCSTVDCSAVYPDMKNLLLRLAIEWGPVVFIVILWKWGQLLWKLIKRARLHGTARDRFLVHALIPMPIMAIGVSSYLWLHWVFLLSYAMYAVHDSPPLRIIGEVREIAEAQ
jgi:hypothetical protein